MERQGHLKPILLQYFVTNRCNAACAFCTIWQDKPKADAQPAQVLQNLADARRAGCRFVDFTGGEPLLHPDLPAFCAAALRLGFITSVTTNCLLFPQRARELAGLVGLLHFSLDADTAELHNKIRGCDSHAKVLESIPAALANDLVPDLLFTYTNENIDSFRGVYELARKNRLMAILDPVFSLDGKDIASRETHDKARAWSRKPGVYLNKAHLALRSGRGNHTARSLCRAASSTIAVLPDNRIALPCFHHAAAFVPVGESLAEALRGPGRGESIRRQGAYPFCEGCHINCYFDPSYTATFSRLTLVSLAAKASYAFMKYVVYRRKFPRNLL
jgi:MoaA/NifB/PqqE/SkfB family radical SAM enzyme